MSKRNPTKPTSRSSSKRFLDPNRKRADISLEKKVKLPENCYLLTPNEYKELGLDTEEEFIIFL